MEQLIISTYIAGETSLRDVAGICGTNHHTVKRVLIKNSISIVRDKKYPKNVLQFSNASQKGKLHPTQKPVSLLEYLIKTYTNEVETVLDFTFGSCSTGIACLNTNRKFIGIELDDNYFEIGAERMRNHIKNE